MDIFFQAPTSLPRDYVNMVWEVSGETNIKEIILPQGVIEIVFNLADRISGTIPQRQPVLHAPRCFIQGIHTHSVQADYFGKQHLFGIRVQPYYVQRLLDVVPSELSNNTIDLTLINSDLADLWCQLVELPSFQERVKLIEKELPPLTGSFCTRSKHLSELFLSGGIESFQSVDTLARQICYSPRQLNRVAHQLFGLSAEELNLYKKLLESIKLIHFGNDSLVDIAYSSGFYDQAHFCRVFKTYTGITPSQYRKSKSTLPFHIIS